MNMSAHALAIELRVPATRINDIVRERRAITHDTALRLARCFGTTAQFWLNLQSSFDLKQAESETGKRIELEVRPGGACAINQNNSIAAKFSPICRGKECHCKALCALAVLRLPT